MTPRPAPDCAHERRPGTTVCLYCRAEERTVVRKRRQRSTVRLLALGAGSAGVLALLLGGIPRSGSSDEGASAAPAPRASDAAGYPVAQAGVVAPAPAAAPAAVLAPAVPMGRTQLAGGIFAERRGDTVVVHFDTQGSRTRRSDKFEALVRETLPRVVGDAGTRALARVAPGALVPAGELLAMLGAGPLRLPTGDGRVVSVMPGARPGQDGPLVVAYRAASAP